MKVLRLLFLLAIAGCATVRNVDTSSELYIRTALRVGDQVALTTRAGQEYQLIVVGLSDGEINGGDRDGRSIVIKYDEIVQLQVRESRPDRTAALVGGGVGGAMLLYSIATAAAAAAILGGS